MPVQGTRPKLPGSRFSGIKNALSLMSNSRNDSQNQSGGASSGTESEVIERLTSDKLTLTKVYNAIKLRIILFTY